LGLLIESPSARTSADINVLRSPKAPP